MITQQYYDLTEKAKQNENQSISCGNNYKNYSLKDIFDIFDKQYSSPEVEESSMIQQVNTQQQQHSDSFLSEIKEIENSISDTHLPYQNFTEFQENQGANNDYQYQFHFDNEPAISFEQLISIYEKDGKFNLEQIIEKCASTVDQEQTIDNNINKNQNLNSFQQQLKNSIQNSKSNNFTSNPAQQLHEQLRQFTANYKSDNIQQNLPSNNIRISNSSTQLHNKNSMRQQLKKKQKQLDNQGEIIKNEKQYNQTNTSHITFNMVNQLFPYLIKVLQTKIRCSCADIQRYYLENQEYNRYKRQVQCELFFEEEQESECQQEKQKCSRCQEIYELTYIKNKGKKTKKTFQSLWKKSKRIQILSEDFFLFKGCSNILSHNQYRNFEGKIALYESLNKFLEGCRGQQFQKLAA